MEWVLSAIADEAGDSCEEQIKALRRAGMVHIDIRGMDGYNISAMPANHAREVKKKLDNAGITVNMLGSPLGKIDISDDFETDRKKLRNLGELAPILDCFEVRVFSYYNKAERPLNEFREESLRRLGVLKDDARRMGLILFHENEMDIYGDYIEHVQTIAEELRDRKSFKTLFDFDNFNQRGEDVWQAWDALREHTDAFHLKDSTLDRQHVPIGQGNGRAKEILADASKRGWVGPLSVEPHLAHSAAVMATGVGGFENQEYSQMSLPDSFHAAVTIAQQLLESIDVKWA